MCRVECSWPAAPVEIRLRPSEIQLWFAELDVPQAVEDMSATLSADERDRAARFATELLRNRFIIGRGPRLIMPGSESLVRQPGFVQHGRFEETNGPVLQPMGREEQMG